MTDNHSTITAMLTPHVGRTGGLITALRAVQDALGHLPPETDAVAASVFNLSRAEVKGVISFYADFHREPKGRTVVRLCAAEACQAQGGRALRAEVERKFALKTGATSASKDLTLEAVYCLGLCSVGPAAMVGGRLVGRATAERVVAAVSRHAKEASR
ncbi:MAG: NAD(P)H-dependent oxidoreductase subunit E [Amphiplicatus sp.]